MDEKIDLTYKYIKIKTVTEAMVSVTCSYVQDKT